MSGDVITGWEGRVATGRFYTDLDTATIAVSGLNTWVTISAGQWWYLDGAVSAHEVDTVELTQGSVPARVTLSGATPPEQTKFAKTIAQITTAPGDASRLIAVPYTSTNLIARSITYDGNVVLYPFPF